VSTNPASGTEVDRFERRGPRGWRWFQDRKLGTKLMTVVLVFVVVFTVVFGLGLTSMVRLSAQTNDTATVQTQVLAPMTYVREDHLLGALLLRRLAMAPTQAQRDVLASRVPSNDVAVNRQIEQVQARLKEPVAQWNDFLTARQRYVTYRDATLIPLAKQGKVAAVESAIAADPGISTDARTQLITDATKVIESRVNASVAAARDRNQKDMWLLVIAFLVGITLAGLFARAVIRETTRAVRGMTRSVDAMSIGDLTVHAPVRSLDEMGAMARALTAAQESLRAMLARVAGTAETLRTASQDLAASNVRIAESSEESSAQALTVATASEEVSTTVRSVAEGAEELSASIRQIAQNATDAATVADHGMKVAESTGTTVSDLGQSSKQIADFVKVITSIAEQTNLLALNATIEAARAGEAGKGFAVVAAEVKELARESARTAEEIAALIESNQAQTVSAVAAISDISEIIQSINEHQSTIASAMEEQSSTTNEISRSVTQAAAGSGDIASNMSAVASSVATSSEVLGRMSVSVAELAGMATELHDRVAEFTY
jgi:methyl-accepting chemotaxis protein